LQKRTDGGVRDISRAIDREVTDGLLEARGKGAKNVRLMGAGTGVRVEITMMSPDMQSAAEKIA
jgi:hypothetical protein